MIVVVMMPATTVGLHLQRKVKLERIVQRHSVIRVELSIIRDHGSFGVSMQ